MPLPSEKTVQEDFYERFNLPVEAIQHNCDGYHNGCLLEFKKSNRTTMNAALFQAVKYLSSFRVRGLPVPARILLVFPSIQTVYLVQSEKYFSDIHKLYHDSASRNTKNWKKPVTEYETINYSEPEGEGAARLNQILHKDKPQWLKITIDEHCVVGWAQTYYRLNPKAKKEDFLYESDDLFNTSGELREPTVLADYIIPYLETGNKKFKYILDKLNDKLTQKELGAFYTPPLYAQKALELVREAIREVPKGNDYVIIDRCAGSGNLQESMTDEELSHCILNTYEYYEYMVLREHYGDKVREIIPPTTEDDYEPIGKVKGSNALNWKEGVHPVMQPYLDNPKCTVILFENPPYRNDIAGNDRRNGDPLKMEESTFVYQAMLKELSMFDNTNVSTVKDLSNRFIWSGMKYFLRQKGDSFILFSPVKYFKSLGIINALFRRGFAFNRKHFHATPSTISCIRWDWTKRTQMQTEFELKTLDIENDKLVSTNKDVVIKKVSEPFTILFDKREFPDDIETTVYCENNGCPTAGRKCDGKSYWNTNILGYLVVKGFSVSPQDVFLLRTTRYNIRGFYLRADNYIEKLPLFCAKCFCQEKWYERDVFFTTADRGDAYTQDKDFLFRCFFWSCLSHRNHCLSFDGSDGRFYRNELCFDKGTITSRELAKHTLNPNERHMLDTWNRLLDKVKKTQEYNQRFSYGLYQIEKEINLRNEDKEYIHPDIHNDIQVLKTLLKTYYAQYIVKKLFDYELLK